MFGYGWDGNFKEINGRINIDQGQLNIELTPAVHLNLDAQVADSALPDIETATILGACLQIRF
jgi:hypothetical protein